MPRLKLYKPHKSERHHSDGTENRFHTYAEHRFHNKDIYSQYPSKKKAPKKR